MAFARRLEGVSTKMKMFLISDNVDTLTGMKIAGIDGVIAHSHQEVDAALTRALADRTLGILLITEKIGKDFEELITNVKITKQLPLIIEVPDRHGTTRSGDFITKYVTESIGLKL